MAHRFLRELGVRFEWTRSKQVPFMSYLGHSIDGENFNTLAMNKDMFQLGKAHIDQNVQQLVHGLFHEAGHAIWSQCWGSVSGTGVNFIEEVWCDNFASDMCRHLGLKWAAEQPSPYAHQLSQLLLEFV